MDASFPLSSEHVTLVDTNVFISIGNPESSKFHRFRRVVRRAGVTLLVPTRIADKIGQSGVKPALERAEDEDCEGRIDSICLTQQGDGSIGYCSAFYRRKITGQGRTRC